MFVSTYEKVNNGRTPTKRHESNLTLNQAYDVILFSDNLIPAEKLLMQKRTQEEQNKSFILSFCRNHKTKIKDK
jgi:uncharacterized protein YciU (UPF0263 family)